MKNVTIMDLCVWLKIKLLIGQVRERMVDISIGDNACLKLICAQKFYNCYISI
jgi:hypothetical protein